MIVDPAGDLQATSLEFIEFRRDLCQLFQQELTFFLGQPDRPPSVPSIP
ncbi:hypothetical protein ACFHW2_40060 [Actinomadura sp. LOL_016]